MWSNVWNRDALKSQVEVKTNQIEQYVVIVEQLRLEQDLELKKLKLALANETAKVENERAAKQEALQER